MTRLVLAGLLASTMLGGAHAATFDFDSGIEAVTVFPSGAQVTRAAKGDVDAGEHTIIIGNLPQGIDPASVRVEGTATGAMSIGSVDVRTELVSKANNPAERRRLEEQLATLQDENGRLKQQLQDIQSQRQMLNKLVTGSVLPRGDSGSAALSADDLAGVLDVAASRMTALTDQTVETNAAIRKVVEEIGQVEAQIRRLAPTGETRTVVAINVNSEAATSANFNVRYNVAQAGWNAIYDAELDLADGVDGLKLAIKRRAEVRQATTEAWDNVKLTLSTARPTSATDAPVLSAQIVDERPDYSVRTEIQSLAPKMRAQGLGAAADMATEFDAEEPVPAPMQEQQAQMNTGGFQATYEIAGSVTVPNDQQSKSVLIGSDEHDASIVAVSVPRIDPAAYLQANFTLSGDATYLPGPVLLTRNGAFIGRGQMPLLAAGETHQLGFGEDDFIRVERRELDRSKGETGLLSTVNTDESRFSITVKNLHDFAMPVRILDQMPVSENKDITVAMLPETTRPDQTDFDGTRGVLAWEPTIDAGGEAGIDFAYKVTWPGDMEISGL